MTRLAYDALSRITELTDALGGVTAFSYDGNGNLLTVTDARGNTTTHTYDSMDRLASRTDPLGHTETFEHDGAGNLVRHTDRKSQATTYSYDPVNRRLEASYAGGGNQTFRYDGTGRLVEASDSASGEILNTYDVLDRLTAQTNPLGTVSYQYDALGRRTRLNVSTQPSVLYSYDLASRLRTITQEPHGPVTLDYDVLDRRTLLTHPNGVSTETQYDAASRVTALIYRSATGVLGDLSYQYDAAGNRTGVGGSFARTRLPTAMAGASYNAANQQITFGSQTLTYDLNGNVSGDGTNTYTWNARNELSGPSITAGFTYDALGRRQSRTVNGQSIQVLYDGLNPIDASGTGGMTALLTGLGIDEYLARATAAGPRTFLVDVLGSTVGLTDSMGVSTTNYTYDPFGTTGVTGNPDGNEFQYTGRERDGTGLYYYRARYYHPERQRFVSEDPIGFGGGDINLYAYVANSPSTWRDPLGRAKFKGITNEPIFVHPSDPDTAPSSPHGHLGSPNSPLKVDVNTGKIFRGTVDTGQKLTWKQLAKLRAALKKAGLLGMLVSLWDILAAEDALAALGSALDPFGALMGEIAPDFEGSSPTCGRKC